MEVYVLVKDGLLDKIREDLFNYDVDSIRVDVEEALKKGLSALDIINALSDCMREIGDKFARLELFLTDLMMAGDAMKAALEILIPKIPKEKALSKGRIVIGTVKGDIHDIGKNIVSAMLTASGFEVYDIGKDASASRFLEEAEKFKADVIGASALMTTTMPALKDLIDYIKAKGYRNKYKIIIGGGAVTKEYAEEIGADAYAENAIEAVKIIKNLIEK
jgi:trimethylamine corrinoid protein